MTTSARVLTSNSISTTSTGIIESDIAYVYDVILDESNEYSKKQNLNCAGNGAIRFRKLGDTSRADKDLKHAFPYDNNIKTLPVRNEQVEIVNLGGVFYYKQLVITENPSDTSAGVEIGQKFEPENDTSLNGPQTYQNVQKTGIARSNGNSTSQEYDGWGEYYNPNPYVHKLKLYEGDTLIESRFGQSIRFSGYNNTLKKLAPTIVIRNRENSENQNISTSNSVTEDINKDGSVIVLSSGENQLNFQPGILNDKGITNFETTPQTFKDYPSKLIGDQILINSGRIILSSKSAEMILYSKKTLGFITDSRVSFDVKLGLRGTFGGNSFLQFGEGKNFEIFTNNGKIQLGGVDQDTNVEPLVLGNKLIKVFEDLIDAITTQQYLTPSGPSKPSPENKPIFDSIKTRLKEILSKYNTTI